MYQHPVLIPITYSKPNFTIRNIGGKQMIWDKIRKKDIILTPEEWVRQNFIQYLVQSLKYPGSLLAIEKEIHVANLSKRCDIVVYKDAHPWMIVECKEPAVSINQKVLEQILNYNMTLKVPFLVLTNGSQTYAIKRTNDNWGYLDALPEWK